MIKLIDLLEKMTPGEKKEKEKIVKGMKKAKGDFKKRYGKDAEAVMYATATKRAMDEDLDVGHQDDEPGMLKNELARAAKMAAMLYKKVDAYDKIEGEVDFPQWWQSKIIKAKDYLQGAFDYLDGAEMTSNIDSMQMEKKGRDLDGDGDVDSDDYLKARDIAIKKAMQKEGMDHEVSMAQNSLKAIAKAAIELSQKIGTVERDIPGWIQDHITNAENYIEQAAQGFHELKGEMNENVKIKTEPAGFRTVEKIISSKDKAAVEQAVAQVERQYPSAGYGTTLKKMYQTSSGVWIAVVRHSTTSD